MYKQLASLLTLGMICSAAGCSPGVDPDGETSTAGDTSADMASDSAAQGSDSASSSDSSGGSSSVSDSGEGSESDATTGGTTGDIGSTTEGDTTGDLTEGDTTEGDTTEGTTEGTTGDTEGTTGDTEGGTGDVPDFVADCEDDPGNPIIVTIERGVTARFPSITAGLASASDGTVIEVCPGVYSEKIEVTLDITLRGAGPDETIIDGGGFHFNLGNGEAVVEGFGFTNCNAKIPNGWNVSSSGAITVSDTYGEQETLTIRKCHFYENTAHYGGALLVSGSNNGGKNPDIYIEDSVFEKNVVTGEGGAIASYGRVHITNSVFLENVARTGGAMALSYGCTGANVCDITDTVIMKNHTVGTGKYEGGGGIFIDSCGNNCLGGLTVTSSDLGFGAAEENTNHEDLPEDIVINDGGDPWNRYGWYYNDVSFTCSNGSCMMP